MAECEREIERGKRRGVREGKRQKDDDHSMRVNPASLLALLCFALLLLFLPSLLFFFATPCALARQGGRGTALPRSTWLFAHPLRCFLHGGGERRVFGKSCCWEGWMVGGGWSPHFQYSGRRRAAKATTATVTTATATDWPTTRPEARSGVRGIMREKLADIGWQDPALVWHGIDGADWLAGVYITWSWRSASTARPRWDFFLLRWPGLSFASSAL